MAKLTTDQLKFLTEQKISLSMLYDASGLSTEERKGQMSRLDKEFYYGGSACKAAGHTLRTRAGHCIQCDTSKIAYQLRSSARGYVYVAESGGGLVKIGFSEFDPYSRELSINTEGYAGITDWRILKSERVEKNAGKCEFDVHAQLEPHRAPIVYQKKPGHYVECREVFKCPKALAIQIFDATLQKYR